MTIFAKRADRTLKLTEGAAALFEVEREQHPGWPESGIGPGKPHWHLVRKSDGKQVYSSSRRFDVIERGNELAGS